MAKRKKEEEGGGSPAWMSTFSDLMNLLLCFFVLLFSMSTPDQQKFQELAAALQASFSFFNAGSTAIGEGVLISSGASQLNELAVYYNNMGMNAQGEVDQEKIEDIAQELHEAALEESEQMAEQIEQMLDEMMISEEVEVIATSKYVVLNLNSGVLFDSGDSSLKEEARTLIDKVSIVLREYETNTISIEGHTDNVPISTSKYPDNTMLSQYRAYSVFSYLVRVKGFSENNMFCIGRGEAVPIASNATAEGRAQNRRVEIKIYNTFNNEQ